MHSEEGSGELTLDEGAWLAVLAGGLVEELGEGVDLGELRCGFILSGGRLFHSEWVELLFLSLLSEWVELFGRLLDWILLLGEWVELLGGLLLNDLLFNDLLSEWVEFLSGLLSWSLLLSEWVELFGGLLSWSLLLSDFFNSFFT